MPSYSYIGYVRILRSLANIQWATPATPYSDKSAYPDKPPKPAKLPFSIGLELTAVYRYHREIGDYTDPAIASHCKHVAKSLNRGYPLFRKRKCKTDGHCLEWPTRVYRDLDTCQQEFEDFRRYSSYFNFQPRHPDTVCGGGHLHITLPTEQAAISLRNFLLHYPVIPWVFLHPCDTDSANFPIQWYDNWTRRYSNAISLKDVAPTKDYYVGRGGGEMTSKRNILEMRFFETAFDWTEQKLHIDFAIALATYITTSHDVHNEPKFYTQQSLSAITRKRALTMWYELCERIGFDATRCEYLIKRNFNVRYQKGYTRT